MKRFIKHQREQLLFYSLVFLMLTLSFTLYVSLSITASTLQENQTAFTTLNHENEMMITPNYYQLDQIIDGISIYSFDGYHALYQNTVFDLNYQQLIDVEHSPYLTSEQVELLQSFINEALVIRLMNASKPSLILYNPLKEEILQSITLPLPSYYKNLIAVKQATEYTRILLLLSLNETNYLKFIEYSLDQKLLAKDETGTYYPSTIASQFDLTIEKKVMTQVKTDLNQQEVNYFLSTKQDTFNEPYITDSLYESTSFFLKSHEIAIFKEFANQNHLKLGDMLQIKSQDYKIVSFVYLPDSIYPLFNVNEFYYNQKRDTIVLLTPEDFTELTQNKYTYIAYNASFNQTPVNLQQAIETLQLNFYQQGLYLTVQVNAGNQVFQTNMNNLNLYSNVMSFSIMILSFIILAVILIRRLNQESHQIGILKALGFPNSKIILNYLMPNVMLVLLAIGVSLITGYFASHILLKTFYHLFLLPFKTLHIDRKLFLALFLPLLILIILCYTILKIKLHNKAIDLLNKEPIVNPKKKAFLYLFLLNIVFSSIFTLWMNVYLKNQMSVLYAILCATFYFILTFMLFKPTFMKRLSLKISGRQIKKLISFQMTILISSILFIVSSYSMSVYQDLIINIKTVDEYVDFVKYPNFLNLTEASLTSCNERMTCQGFSSYQFPLLSVNDTPINELIRVHGYANHDYLVQTYDPSKIDERTVVVTQPVADYYHIKVNDSIVIETNRIVTDNSTQKDVCYFDVTQECETIQLTVGAIDPNYASYFIYTTLEDANYWYYGNRNNPFHINTIYTSEPIESTLSLNDSLMNNQMVHYQVDSLLNQMDHLFYTLRTIILLSFIILSIIIFILLLIINDLLIKDLKFEIATFKSMGYTKREIRKILFSHYPILFMMSVLMSFPIAFSLTTYFYHYLGTTINLTLTVQFHLFTLIAIFILLYALFLITNFLIQLRLNKISLSILLKSE